MARSLSVSRWLIQNSGPLLPWSLTPLSRTLSMAAGLAPYMTDRSQLLMVLSSGAESYPQSRADAVSAPHRPIHIAAASQPGRGRRRGYNARKAHEGPN